MDKQYKKAIEEMAGIEHCERCGVHFLSVFLGASHHHIIYRSEAPKHTNLHHIRNIIKVCMNCHNFFHSHKEERKSLVIERELWDLFPELRLKERYYLISNK